LYVESCNQCSACKFNLGVASGALDELFDAHPKPGAPDRAVIAARRAPQANRCYLPVQGAILIPSLVKRHRSEFDAVAAAEPIPIPKMNDHDDERHLFPYDHPQPLQLPSWTYRTAPPARREPPPAVHPQPAPVRPVEVEIDPDVVAALLE